MVGYQDNQRAFPASAAFQIVYKTPHTSISIGKSIQHFILQVVVRHIERFMRTARLYDAHHRLSRLFLQVVLHLFKQQMIGYSPFTPTVFMWKILIRHMVGNAHSRQITTQISEVNVSTVVVFQPISALVQHACNRREMIGFSG